MAVTELMDWWPTQSHFKFLTMPFAVFIENEKNPKHKENRLKNIST